MLWVGARTPGFELEPKKKPPHCVGTGSTDGERSNCADGWSRAPNVAPSVDEVARGRVISR
jgi:hypothetical protein